MAVLRLLKISEDAIVPSFDYNSHYTLYALEDSQIHANQTALIRTGIKMAIPIDYCALIVSNGKYKIGGGLIDSDYRGELKVIVHATSEIPISRGEAIAKMFVLEIGMPEIELQEDSILAECDEALNHSVEN